jgi:AbrB family looped-hinge helix DNA binding protein
MSTNLRIRRNGQITLPASIRREANLQAGDTLEVIVEEDGVICLVRQIQFDRSQDYFRTGRWQAGERETEADFMAGGYLDFDNIDDLLAELETEDG